MQRQAAGRATNKAAERRRTRPASSSAALGSSGGGVSSWRSSSASPACAASCRGLHRSGREREGCKSVQGGGGRQRRRQAAAAAGGGAAWRAAAALLRCELGALYNARGAGPDAAATRREHSFERRRASVRRFGNRYQAAASLWTLIRCCRAGRRRSQGVWPLVHVAVAICVRHCWSSTPGRLRPIGEPWSPPNAGCGA